MLHVTALKTGVCFHSISPSSEIESYAYDSCLSLVSDLFNEDQ